MDRLLKPLSFPLLCYLTSAMAMAAPMEEARQFLRENRVFTDGITKPADYDLRHRQIEARDDPQSKFGYIVFSVARHRGKLLTEHQSKSVETLLEARQSSPINWHELRNIVRLYAVQELWNYSTAQSAPEAESARVRWEQWTDLRIAYMFEEFVDKERFQKAFQDILSKEQKKALLSGEWDTYLKRNTGHGRLYSAPKQVTRIFGKPDHAKPFAATARKWEDRWEPMLKNYLAASRFQRQREFSMDLADESFSVASWSEYSKEFRRFVTMERDAIRELVQVGYDADGNFEANLLTAQRKLEEDISTRKE